MEGDSLLIESDNGSGGNSLKPDILGRYYTFLGHNVEKMSFYNLTETEFFCLNINSSY